MELVFKYRRYFSDFTVYVNIIVKLANKVLTPIFFSFVLWKQTKSFEKRVFCSILDMKSLND
ncbi:hypothetical protein SAMN05661044_00336 [Olivibacter domesticus]|uniref:Uncharacterized protein n=1 Tax=Olivibacter domesticus TaxID=407022 RepID=A0A1H7HEB7_OLID1|nr:hypothetical protein SAMN05661044_00336 [Olivibacter domesticus]